MMVQGKHLFHFLKVKYLGAEASTQTSKAEQLALRKLSSGKSTIVEIGVFEGFNTTIFAEHMSQEGHVYGIDPFFRGRLGFSYTKLITQTVLMRKGLTDKVTFIEALSGSEMATINSPKKIDFLFIDGDHSFEGVGLDFEIYANRLSSDGLVALHDARLFENGWTEADWGPVRLLQEVILPSKQWMIVLEVDSLVVLRKLH